VLNEVPDGVWVRQSAWVWSNTTVVRGDDGLVLADPGVLIPGHGAVARGPEVTARPATDRAYIDALRRGEEPPGERWGPRGQGA
jgi:hypothetical protein